MNGDIVCNGQSTHHTYLSSSNPRPRFLDGNSVSLIHEGKFLGRRTTHNETQKYEEARLNVVNAEASIPSGAEKDRLCPPSMTEAQARPLHCTATYVHSTGEPTAGNNIAPAPNNRRGTCRKVKVKKSTMRTAESKNSQNRKVTDYYPIRRSSRKSKAELQCEEKRHIDELITNGIEEGMMVRNTDGKGRGVFATQHFNKGQFVVEYHGDLLKITDAKKREAMYAQDPSTGCYMYYFQYLSKTYCVDATIETGRMGRLINHSKNGNCQTKLHDINGIPHLILVASRDIDEGEELLYDYGDRSKASIAAHPWLKH
ncbi:N-lysine methyltransferase KMT5A-A [Megalops cyprinoides]|uniref:N-lysine methyltransferase KMT5A-A n=1 Tax=Megalops cyprinoides TaxID=118141 RepID=UPI0018651D2F|nr:N-lysine methyltransferase KMT5A-A [Megalops cyprinoides]